MKKTVRKYAGFVGALGAALAIGSVLWLVISHTLLEKPVGLNIFLLILFAAIMLGGWVGCRFFPKQHIWPGLCLLFSVPACIWAGVVGPAALLDYSYSVIFEMMAGYIFPALYYVPLPGLVVALVNACCFGILGIIWLYADIYFMVRGEPEPRQEQLITRRTVRSGRAPKAAAAAAPPPVPLPAPQEEQPEPATGVALAAAMSHQVLDERPTAEVPPAAPAPQRAQRVETPPPAGDKPPPTVHRATPPAGAEKGQERKKGAYATRPIARQSMLDRIKVRPQKARTEPSPPARAEQPKPMMANPYAEENGSADSEEQ